MANTVYPKARQAFLNKEHSLPTDVIKATLIDGGDYTYGATHNTYVQGTFGVPDAAKVAVVTLTTPTIVDGVFDTADFVWTAVSGDISENIITWNDTPTTPTADPLLSFYDTGMIGMPVTPNGGNINGTVHTTGWFVL